MKKRSEIPFMVRSAWAFMLGLLIAHWFFPPSLNWTGIPQNQWEAVSQIVGAIYGTACILSVTLLSLMTTDD